MSSEAKTRPEAGPEACFPSFSKFRGACKYPARLYATISLLYLALVFSTMTDPGFRSFSHDAFLFYGGVFVSFLFSWVIGRPSEGPPPKWLYLYFVVQAVIYILLTLLPVPHGEQWLMLMPVVSHAAFFLSMPALVAVCACFLSILVWSHLGMDLTGGPVIRLFVSFGAAFLFTIVYTLITRNAIAAHAEARRLADELAVANKMLLGANKLLRETADRNASLAAMSERNRIARDIHDGLGHYMTIVAVQLEGARKLLDKDPARASAALEKAEELSRSALDEIRRSVATLRCSNPSPAIEEALSGLVSESGLPAVFRVSGKSRQLEDCATQALFRATQEGLTNIRKHAAASSKVEVTLRFEEEKVSVQISDNGRGASPGVPPGFGLSGLRERMESLGGRLLAANRVEGGFQLEAELPA